VEQIFITGENRGIGLELTRQYLQSGDVRVFAACRSPQDAAALYRLKADHPDNLIVLALEVTDAESISSAAKTVRDTSDRLDILINNAGIEAPGREQSFEGISPQVMQRVYAVNSIAPLMIARALVDFLRMGKHPRLINISSEMGSITHRDYGGSYAYCASKAALNMITRGLAADLQPRGIIVTALDPGWVQTDMGGAGADLTPQESVSGMMKVIAGLKMADSGAFLRWDGSSLPW
jgi:NAD(P)-dependent dehydrogenase (short-subunit alcohol dehydrogenase family)